jgi:hypothetical protein
MNLARTLPREDLASTGFCLADPGRQYLVFLPKGGEAVVDLTGSAGELAVEWRDAAQGAVSQAGTIQGGGKSKLKAPFAGPALVYLWRK